MSTRTSIQQPKSLVQTSGAASLQNNARVSPLRHAAMSAAKLAGEAVSELLWPTRCALCDRPGEVLCERCRAMLPPVDVLLACPRCGSPYGRVQCDFCNEVTLGRIGRTELPFENCASAMLFTAETGHIVRVFKDQGECRLAQEMGDAMARHVPPAWNIQAVTYVPASKAAYRYRGYDHGELLGRAVAERLQLPAIPLLGRPTTRDQRKLSALGRISNLQGRFMPLAGAQPCERVLLVDDVFTTGATLCAASDALHALGCNDVYCLTFARV